VAEHAQAGAHRAPAPALRGAPREPRRAPRGDRYFALFEASRPDGHPPPLPAVLHVAFVDQLLQRMREHGAGASELRKRLEARLEGVGATVEDAVRAEHQRLAMNHVSMGNSVTSLRLAPRSTGTTRREREPDRADPAPRPAGHLRTHGLREPRSLPPRGRGTGGAERRGAGARRPARVESARQAAETSGIDPRVAHVGYHLIGGGRRELEIDVASQPAMHMRLERTLFAHATFFYLGTLALLTGLGVAAAVA